MFFKCIYSNELGLKGAGFNDDVKILTTKCVNKLLESAVRANTIKQTMFLIVLTYLISFLRSVKTVIV